MDIPQAQGGKDACAPAIREEEAIPQQGTALLPGSLLSGTVPLHVRQLISFVAETLLSGAPSLSASHEEQVVN